MPVDTCWIHIILTANKENIPGTGQLLARSYAGFFDHRFEQCLLCVIQKVGNDRTEFALCNG